MKRTATDLYCGDSNPNEARQETRGAPFQQETSTPPILNIHKEPFMDIPPILKLHNELFRYITPFTDERSQLALACTCTKLYYYHKLLYVEKTGMWVSNTNYESRMHECIKKTESILSRNGWEIVKAKIETASVEPEKQYPHPVWALHLKNTFQLQMGINPALLTTLVLEFSYGNRTPEVTGAFLGMYENLMLLSLSGVSFGNEDNVPDGLKLPLLKAIYLSMCSWSHNYVPKILNTCCEDLQEIYFAYCTSSNTEPPNFPPSVKILSIRGWNTKSKQIVLADCTRLRDL
jgi:hypothetical protein